MGAYRKPIQIVILLGVLLIGGYAIGKTLFADEAGPLRPGDEPPPFTLLDLAGNARALSDYEGKALVITFWGTFCPPCVKEMPEFQKQYERWQGEDLEILAINLSESDLPVRNFVQQHGLEFPILRDVKRKVEREYGLKVYPTTFFVGKDGKIKEIAEVPMTDKQIEERIERIL
ncbi:redoxin domain-containing protein [Paenibacillus sp. IB182496]|uniref:Redoxin domain-containing protein n=1 Tax=Paenibacillus sabuli TaxID=2772509 RepID=A0A927BWU3_9BACL|nr:redoxin domain-containing protein [Paenibacillus sabuli]MBD2846803.1 redoxin domain-containing protein [Paenibacillus sabuli]